MSPWYRVDPIYISYIVVIYYTLINCHLGTEWLLIYYSIYSNVTLIQSGSYLYIIYCYILYIIQFIQIPPWYRVAPIDFGRRKLAKTELTPHPKRKLVTFALHQHFVFTIDKIAALLKIKLIALLNAFH